MNTMNNHEYLQEILRLQTLTPQSQELKELQKHRADVEGILLEHFSQSSPTIRYGGSRAKETMIKEAYDLDMICYFPHDRYRGGRDA
jgi:tRNA nucleotidyltransferase (CCA-adding enzyme)